MRAVQRSRVRQAAGWVAFAVVTTAAAQPTPPQGPAAPAHHTAGGFVNNYPHPPKSSFWAWQWERWCDGVPQAPPQGWNLPSVPVDAAQLRSVASNPSMT